MHVDRRLLAAAGLTLAAVLAVPNGSTPAEPLGPATSVAYQQNVRHDGRVVEPDLAPPFEVAWIRRMWAPSYPLIVDGRVFVTSRFDEGGRLRALDQATGSTLWAKDLPTPWSNAAYDDGTVFVLTAGGTLSASDATTGAPGWTIDLPLQYSFSSPPTAAGGLVYTGGAGTGGTLYAVDQATGDLAWSTPVANGDSSSPALSSDHVFVSYACQRVYAFDRTTGDSVWDHSTDCSGGGGRTAALHRGLLYTRDWVYDPLIFDTTDGAVTGTFSSETIPAFAAGMMIADTGVRITASDVATGTVVWSERLDAKVVSAPIVVNRAVIVASSDGTVWALRLQTGRVIWSTDLGTPIAGPDEQNRSEPLTGLGAGGGMVIVPTERTLVALRPVGA